MTERIRFVLLLLTAIVGLPACLAYAWFLATGDLTLRPLAQVRGDFSELRLIRPNGQVQVHVFWGTDLRNQQNREDVTQALQDALQLYDLDFQVTYVLTKGDRIRVSYKVNETLYGPFPLRQASQGLRLAVEALRIR